MKRKHLLAFTFILTGALTLYTGLELPEHDLLPKLIW